MIYSHHNFFKITSLLILITTLITLVACGDIQSTSEASNKIAATATMNVNSTQTSIQSTFVTTLPAKLTPSPQSSQDWTTRWINNIPCRLPCWEGIIPGVTTVDQAIELLNKNSVIKNIKKSTSYNGKGYLEWDLTNNKKGFANFYSNKPTQIIYYILPYFNNLSFNLNKIVASYGEPSNIIATAVKNPEQGISYKLMLIYLDKGFALTNFGSNKLILKSEMDFEQLDIFIPNTSGFDEAFPGKKFDIKSWQGFRDFNYYCEAIGWADFTDCSKIP